jgi:hypothetical protein
MTVVAKTVDALKQLVTQHPAFPICLLATVAFAYGFAIFHPAVGWDDTAIGRYFREGAYLTAGRYGYNVLDFLFHQSGFLPVWRDLLAVSSLFAFCLVFSAWLRAVAGNLISPPAMIIFSTLFISYPLINEFFIYNNSNLEVCFGYVLVALSLVTTWGYIESRARWQLAAVAALLLNLSIAIYESHVAVYVAGGLIALTLQELAQARRAEEQPLRRLGASLRILLTIAAVAVVSKIVISSLIQHGMAIADRKWAANQIFWKLDSTLISQIHDLISQAGMSLLTDALWYQPIQIFAATTVVFSAIAFLIWIRYRSTRAILLMSGIFLTNFAMSAIAGSLAPYRSFQVLPLFIGFVWMLAYILLEETRLRLFVVAAVALLVLHQTRDLSGWFYNDLRRYEQDSIFGAQIGAEVERVVGRNSKMPLVLLGHPAPYENLRANQVNGWSIFDYGENAFGERGAESIKFLELLGYMFTVPDDETWEAALVLSKDMPVWPLAGSSKVIGGMAIVKFREQPELVSIDAGVEDLGVNDGADFAKMAYFEVGTNGKGVLWVDGQAFFFHKNSRETRIDVLFQSPHRSYVVRGVQDRHPRDRSSYGLAEMNLRYMNSVDYSWSAFHVRELRASGAESGVYRVSVVLTNGGDRVVLQTGRTVALP